VQHSACFDTVKRLDTSFHRSYLVTYPMVHHTVFTDLLKSGHKEVIWNDISEKKEYKYK